MAKISSEERARRKQMYDAVILNIFMTESWEAITYDRLARELTISKSTLQRYYPSRMHFVTALQGKVMPIVARNLDFSSSQLFISSWESALRNDLHFRNVVRMFIDNLMSRSPHPSTQGAMMRLLDQLQTVTSDEDAHKTLKIALGTSVLSFNNFL
ncbi:TetR/AcrR family transcriptional regulator [Endozoicomonas elysicola]|uniref:HTH tetR-type domain-containing protein n=1 Tax=Endozoicomonas elysicola TaxID=305900 RepID=A0A081KB31_9GAMM|nr:TetR/AcrR family transcriptional regulator [Endozoicomonas elysicola]KEI71357.1 hypothetical protein GV64_11935 [Endozoicomonas elysicola]